MRIGVDYYPEHWDKSMWETDISMMKDAGVSLVRLAEFAWCRMEPQEGLYDFTWLDNVISLFYEYGIEVVLGTPTPTPPNWLVKKYPDVLPVDSKQHVVFPGVRCHRCYNSPSLRRYAELLIEKLTDRYADNPSVIGWQTDNEFGLIECNCDNCNRKFREWLKNKYKTLENVNLKWGTVVWSGEYSEWEQITTPLGGSPYLNPSYLLDYYRFCSHSAVEFQKIHIDIIRKNCPDHFITHNIWGYPVIIDYYDLCEDLDFASHDYYPYTNLEDKTHKSIYHGALSHDLVRGVKRKNFWVMEQLSGTPGCWKPMLRAPYPGMIRAYAWQSISRGADAVVHFRWRSAIIGAEQFWHGLIDHSNIPGRRFEEFKRFSSEVNRLSEYIDGTEIINHIAILHSHEQYAALRIQPQVEGMDYFEVLKGIHNTFIRLGAGTDVINWIENLDGYSLIIAPLLYLTDENTADKIEEYARNGGTVILTNRTGVKNLENICWMEPLPGLFSECSGVIVEEYDPIGKDAHKIRFVNDKEYICRHWCDILKPAQAQTIGWYEDDFFAGKPAVTINSYGKGKVYYLGAGMDADFYMDFFGELLKNLNIMHHGNLPEGVEVSIREAQNRKVLFILNTTKEVKYFHAGKKYEDLITGEKQCETIMLEAFDVKVLLMQ